MPSPELLPIFDDGFATLLSIEHRRSLSRLMNPERPASVPASQFNGVKADIVKTLSPFASATLLDFAGARQCRLGRFIPKEAPLVLALELDAYSEVGGERMTLPDKELTPGKARRFGADAVKLKLHYNPRYLNSAKAQARLLKSVHKACTASHIPLILEPSLYEVSIDLWEGAVLNCAREFSPLCSMLSLQFPSKSAEPRRAVQACRRISDSSSVPWILSSDLDEFMELMWKSEMACRGGACGFSAGLAVWREAVRLPAAERARFLNVVSSGRFIRLRRVLKRCAEEVADAF